jgi:hypothetical protein
MMNNSPRRYLNTVLPFSLAQLSLAILADKSILVLASSHRIIGIFLDECCHGMTATLCWICTLQLVGVASNPSSKVFMSESLLAFISGCVVDIDHFIAAGKFSLHAATHLQRRPFGHSIIFIIISTIAVRLLSSYRLTLLYVSSVFCHLLRDSTRRGFTLYLDGSYSTPPLPYFVYIAAVCILPIFLSQSLLPVNLAVQQKDKASLQDTADTRDRDILSV